MIFRFFAHVREDKRSLENGISFLTSMSKFTERQVPQPRAGGRGESRTEVGRVSYNSSLSWRGGKSQSGQRGTQQQGLGRLAASLSS